LWGRIVRTIAFVALGLVVSACATVTRGTTEQVQFFSDPPGAQVHTSLGHSCVTPCTLQFGRKEEFTVNYSKPGYVSQEVPVTTRVAGAGAAGFAGNVIVGGVVGMAADVATGSALEHVPNPVTITLEPVGAAKSHTAPRVKPPSS
jgi:hypothetical protein